MVIRTKEQGFWPLRVPYHDFGQGPGRVDEGESVRAWEESSTDGGVRESLLENLGVMDAGWDGKSPDLPRRGVRGESDCPDGDSRGLRGREQKGFSVSPDTVEA